MAERRVHCVAVLARPDESYRLGRLWGIVSDLDLAAAASLDLDVRLAGGAAASPVVTVTPEEYGPAGVCVQVSGEPSDELDPKSIEAGALHTVDATTLTSLQTQAGGSIMPSQVAVEHIAS